MPRPELGPVAVGDELIVIDGVRRGEVRTILAEVVKVGPVWVTLEPVGGGYLPSRGRFRVKDQREENTAGYRASFCTPEQKAWDDREHAADQYLREERIETHNSRRWSADKVTLANLIREHEGLDPL
jgi:hypothetical protein